MAPRGASKTGKPAKRKASSKAPARKKAGKTAKPKAKGATKTTATRAPKKKAAAKGTAKKRRSAAAKQTSALGDAVQRALPLIPGVGRWIGRTIG